MFLDGHLEQTNLALGRVFEGHLNAIRLLHRLVVVAQFRGVAADVCGGHLIGLWVTSFADPVRVVQIYRVECRCGARLMCGVVGIAGRAVIMVSDAGGAEQLAYVATSEVVVVGERQLALMGMRTAMTAPVYMAGTVPQSSTFAASGDDTAEPDFPGGAWRTSAVTVGGRYDEPASGARSCI